MEKLPKDLFGRPQVNRPIHMLSTWLAFSSHNKLDNLLAIVDINRLGQSQETQLGHDIKTYAKRFDAFGWHTISVTFV